MQNLAVWLYVLGKYDHVTGFYHILSLLSLPCLNYYAHEMHLSCYLHALYIGQKCYS